MGNGNSSVKRVFEMLDRDDDGQLTLEQILNLKNVDAEDISDLPEEALASPLLLLKFDSGQHGTINYHEFSKLIKYLQLQVQKRKKKKHSATSPVRSRKAWTSVDQQTKNELDLDRDSGTPMITRKGNDAPPLTTSSSPSEEDSSEEEEDLRDLIQREAKKFFEKLIHTPEGRKKFLTWLFHLADVDKSNTVNTEELGLMIQAISKDGIMPENLSFDGVNDPVLLAQTVLEEYDTKHSGFLTFDTFVNFADLILKNYESRMDMKQEHVGKYLLKRKLAKGSSGVVWMAIHTETKEKKAVKVIHKGDVSELSRVDTEIKAMLMLKHPNIVSLDEVLETEQNVYFIMELCGGGPLSEHVALQPLTEVYARYYFVQLIKAVKFCHEQGVVHRDLKLENLLLDLEGHLKISDFGHAGIFSKGWDLFATCLVGSLMHLSPEQVTGQCYSGEKVDIWACGVLLYRLVAGTPPFFCTDPQEFVEKIKAAKFDIPKNMSDELADLIKRILRPTKEERPSLDDILAHPWCKLPAKQPVLIRKQLALNVGLDVYTVWKLLKEVIEELNIHFQDVPRTPDLPRRVKKVAKCMFPAKDLKIQITYFVDDHHACLEYFLKEGEFWQFDEKIQKITTKLVAKLKSRDMKVDNDKLTEPLDAPVVAKAKKHKPREQDSSSEDSGNESSSSSSSSSSVASSSSSVSSTKRARDRKQRKSKELKKKAESDRSLSRHRSDHDSTSDVPKLSKGKSSDKGMTSDAKSSKEEHTYSNPSPEPHRLSSSATLSRKRHTHTDSESTESSSKLRGRNKSNAKDKEPIFDLRTSKGSHSHHSHHHHNKKEHSSDSYKFADTEPPLNEKKDNSILIELQEPSMPDLSPSPFTSMTTLMPDPNTRIDLSLSEVTEQPISSPRELKSSRAELTRSEGTRERRNSTRESSKSIKSPLESHKDDSEDKSSRSELKRSKDKILIPHKEHSHSHSHHHHHHKHHKKQEEEDEASSSSSSSDSEARPMTQGYPRESSTATNEEDKTFVVTNTSDSSDDESKSKEEEKKSKKLRRRSNYYSASESGLSSATGTIDEKDKRHSNGKKSNSDSHLAPEEYSVSHQPLEDEKDQETKRKKALKESRIDIKKPRDHADSSDEESSSDAESSSESSSSRKSKKITDRIIETFRPSKAKEKLHQQLLQQQQQQQQQLKKRNSKKLDEDSEMSNKSISEESKSKAT